MEHIHDLVDKMDDDQAPETSDNISANSRNNENEEGFFERMSSTASNYLHQMTEFHNDLLLRENFDHTDDKKLVEHFALPEKQRELGNLEESQIGLAVNDYHRQKKKILIQRGMLNMLNKFA